jgi:hypothetical protein
VRGNGTYRLRVQRRDGPAVVIDASTPRLDVDADGKSFRIAGWRFEWRQVIEVGLIDTAGGGKSPDLGLASRL